MITSKFEPAVTLLANDVTVDALVDGFGLWQVRAHRAGYLLEDVDRLLDDVVRNFGHDGRISCTLIKKLNYNSKSDSLTIECKRSS